MWHADPSHRYRGLWKTSQDRDQDTDLTLDLNPSNQWSLGSAACPDAVRILPVAPEERLPRPADDFLRDSEWHISCPQGDASDSVGTFGVHLVASHVATQVGALVMELIVSIQTTLLDSEPTLDLKLQSDTAVSSSADNAIHTAEVGSQRWSILLGPHDAPFTTNQSTSHELDLRLFGEFMEKGVIRKGRPWIVVESTSTAAADLGKILQQLTDSPLPLTA